MLTIKDSCETCWSEPLMSTLKNLHRSHKQQDCHIIYSDSFPLTGTLKSPTGVFTFSAESGVLGISETGLGVDISEKHFSLLTTWTRK